MEELTEEEFASGGPQEGAGQEVGKVVETVHGATGEITGTDPEIDETEYRAHTMRDPFEKFR